MFLQLLFRLVTDPNLNINLIIQLKVALHNTFFQDAQTLLSTSFLATTLHLSSTYLLSQQCPAQLPVPGSSCKTTIALVCPFHRTHQQSQVTIFCFF